MYLVTVTNVKKRKKIERRRELNHELYDCSCCLIASASSRATNLSTKLLFFSLLFPQSGEKMTSNSLESSLRFTYQRIRVRSIRNLFFPFYRQFSFDSSRVWQIQLIRIVRSKMQDRIFYAFERRKASFPLI